MKKFQVIILILVIIIIAGLIGVFRLGLFSTQKNTFTQPATESTTKNNSQRQTIDEIGLSFQMPAGTSFRKEVAEDSAGIHAVGFYVEKKVDNNLTYTLYGVYQPNIEATEQDLEKSKIGMDTATIKAVTIGGVQGIEGLVTGPKTRYMTVLLRNNRILTISTIPPTTENKTLTDQILSTFEFK